MPLFYMTCGCHPTIFKHGYHYFSGTTYRLPFYHICHLGRMGLHTPPLQHTHLLTHCVAGSPLPHLPHAPIYMPPSDIYLCYAQPHLYYMDYAHSCTFQARLPAPLDPTPPTPDFCLC